MSVLTGHPTLYLTALTALACPHSYRDVLANKEKELDEATARAAKYEARIAALQQEVSTANAKSAIAQASHKAEVVKWQGQVESLRMAVTQARTRGARADELLHEKNATIQRLTIDLRHMQERHALQAAAIAELGVDGARPPAQGRYVARSPSAGTAPALNAVLISMSVYPHPVPYSGVVGSSGSVSGSSVGSSTKASKRGGVTRGPRRTRRTKARASRAASTPGNPTSMPRPRRATARRRSDATASTAQAGSAATGSVGGPAAASSDTSSARGDRGHLAGFTFPSYATGGDAAAPPTAAPTLQAEPLPARAVGSDASQHRYSDKASRTGDTDDDGSVSSDSDEFGRQLLSRLDEASTSQRDLTNTGDALLAQDQEYRALRAEADAAAARAARAAREVTLLAAATRTELATSPAGGASDPGVAVRAGPVSNDGAAGEASRQYGDAAPPPTPTRVSVEPAAAPTPTTMRRLRVQEAASALSVSDEASLNGSASVAGSRFLDDSSVSDFSSSGIHSEIQRLQTRILATMQNA